LREGSSARAGESAPDAARTQSSGQRKQTLKFVNGYAVPVDLPAPAGAASIGAYPGAHAHAPEPAAAAPAAAPFAGKVVTPGWLINDKKARGCAAAAASAQAARRQAGQSARMVRF
jgi:hypothetical protein